MAGGVRREGGFQDHRFVGRVDELNALLDAAREAARGRGRLVLVRGEAGIGKTRLVGELMVRVRRRHRRVLSGRCLSGGAPTSFAPIAHALGGVVAECDDAERAELRRIAPDLARIFPALGSPVATLGDQDVDRLRLTEALITLLRRTFARCDGSLLVVDDLHWADSGTLAVLDVLVDLCPALSCLVVATLRADADADLDHRVATWAAGDARLLDLRPLGDDEVRSLIAEVSPGVAADDEVVRLLVHRSGGNPFVVEELLATAGRDSPDGFGGPPPAEWLAQIALPVGVLDRVLARVRSLPRSARELLRNAAVLGAEFDTDVLRSMSGADAEAALEAARDARAVMPVDGGGGRWRFRHDLVREAILCELSRSERKALHRGAASSLLASDHPPTLAVVAHLVAAEQWDDAAEMCLTAGHPDGDGERRVDLADAAPLVEAVLRHERSGLRRARLLILLGQAQLRAGSEIDRAIQSLDEGTRTLRRLNAADASAPFEMELAQALGERGEQKQAKELALGAIGVLERRGPSVALGRALLDLGQIEFNLDRRAMADAARRAAEIGVTVGDERLRLTAAILEEFARPIEDFDVAAVRLEAIARDAARSGLDDVAVDALVHLARRLAPLGRCDEAAGAIRRSSSMPAHVRFRNTMLQCELECRWQLGDIRGALELLDAEVASARRTQRHERLCELALDGTVVYAESGRLDDAEALLAEFAAHARTPHRAGLVLRDDAAVALAQGDLGRAVRAAEEALALGYRPQVPIAWFVEGAALAGRAALARTMVTAWSAGPPWDVAMASAWCAVAEARWDDALAVLSPAVSDAEARGARRLAMSLRRVGAHALVGAGRLADATAAVDGVEEAARDMGLRTFERRMAQLRRTACLPAPDGEHRAGPVGLTRREIVVARLVAEGMTNKELARRLAVAERTAEGHVERLRRKLGVRSRAQVAAWAVRHGREADRT